MRFEICCPDGGHMLNAPLLQIHTVSLARRSRLLWRPTTERPGSARATRLSLPLRLPPHHVGERHSRAGVKKWCANADGGHWKATAAGAWWADGGRRLTPPHDAPLLHTHTVSLARRSRLLWGPTTGRPGSARDHASLSRSDCHHAMWGRGTATQGRQDPRPRGDSVHTNHSIILAASRSGLPRTGVADTEDGSVH